MAYNYSTKKASVISVSHTFNWGSWGTNCLPVQIHKQAALSQLRLIAMKHAPRLPLLSLLLVILAGAAQAADTTVSEGFEAGLAVVNQVLLQPAPPPSQLRFPASQHINLQRMMP